MVLMINVFEIVQITFFQINNYNWEKFAKLELY